MFTVKFDTENAAFEENPEEETASVLRRIADDVRNGATEGVARDSNGNTIGRWSL